MIVFIEETDKNVEIYITAVYDNPLIKNQLETLL